MECGLIEIYIATRINISEFVRKTRSRQCIPASMCNLQEKHPDRMYRLFVFCNTIYKDERNYRESQDLSLLFTFYNEPISEYNCIEPFKIGDRCDYQRS